MSRQPVVSVVVPYFNPGDRFLREAIDSVRAQTDTRWELLLVDDGSTDGTSRVGQEAADNDPERVWYFDHSEHANRGKSTSRNLGIEHARGRYIVFLDADDVLLPHKLAHQSALLDSLPGAAAVYGRTRYWHSWALPNAADRKSSWTRRLPPDGLSRLWVTWGQTHEPPQLLRTYLRRSGSVPCLCAWMMRTDTVRQLGGFDESIQQLYEDQVLIAKLALECPIHVDLDCGEKYRQHSDSSSALAVRAGDYHPWRPNAARRQYLAWLEDRVQHHASPDHRDELRRLVSAQLRPYRVPGGSFFYAGVAPLRHCYASVRDRVVARLFPEPEI